MRDSLVVVELDPLRIDEHQPDLVRRRVHEDRGQDRVDAPRLSRAGRTGDEHVRHQRQVGAHGLAGDVLAEPAEQRRGALRRLGVDVAEADQSPALVRDLDPDRLLPRNRSEDADVGRGERVGEVVLQLSDLRDLRPGRELELVAAHVRAADGSQQPRFDPEVAQRLEQRARRRLAVAHVRTRIGLPPLERLRGRRPVIDLVGRGDPVGVALVAHRRDARSALRSRLGLARLGARGSVIPAGLGVSEPVGFRALLALAPLDGDRLLLVLGHERLRLEALGLDLSGDRDLLAASVAPGVGRRGRGAAHCARHLTAVGPGATHRPARRSEEPRDRRPGDQQGARDDHQQRQDVGADALEERARGPVERLAEDPAVGDHEPVLEVVVAAGMIWSEPGGLRGEGEQQRGDHEDPAGVQRRGGVELLSRDQRRAPAGERDRRHIGDPAGEVGERVGDPAADDSPVPAEVEDQRQVDRRREQPEPDDVVVTLLEAVDELACRGDGRGGGATATCDEGAAPPSGEPGWIGAWTREVSC